MAKKKIKKEDSLNEEMKRFDLWFQKNLDRSFSDDVIVSVLQYHVISSYINVGADFDSMMKLMLEQYNFLMDQKERNTG